ncbi:SDR family oxidoreductase [Paeniglutamicibacter cryotolerans]|uniref:NADH dehydrogenase n=1 Tax=Paeniglutamicibacter cryotolerans TaxID=670079 RepID=A0A839QMZ2_9MICC|nr:SDR family oxidoreductase [Paeniglutamicibacter cryotolerans]MBB2997619.1 NADH dehydrogenase [Paeniglutamicibacter cryotolerans]
MILLTGGTGTVGRELVRLLQDSGQPHRVLTRSLESARRLEAAGSPAVVGDVQHSPDLAAAVCGCDMIISAMTGFGPSSGSSPAVVDRDGNLNLIRAAQDAGVQRFVLFSVRGAEAGHHLELNRMKFTAEQALRDSELGWTILRPTIILETFTGIMEESLDRHGVVVVFGSGDRPVNFVCASYAACTALVAAQSRDLYRSAVEVAGPENLTFNELASLVITRYGSGRVLHVPLPVLRAMEFSAKTLAPRWGRVLGAAIWMCTADMTSKAALTYESLSRIPVKTIREALNESP